MKTMKIAGYEMTVEKKNIKHLHIYIKAPEGKIHVTVPRHMSEESVRHAVESKVLWIQKHKERMEKVSPPVRMTYSDGELLYLWGKPYVIEVEQVSRGKGAVISGEKVILRVPRTYTAAQREKVVEHWYREQLSLEIPQLMEKWEGIMGVKSCSWHIRKMKTRWGTCNTRDRRIWLSLHLAKKTKECLEYVVVHELCHLIERSHNEVFKHWMTCFLPDWRIRRKALK